MNCIKLLKFNYNKNYQVGRRTIYSCSNLNKCFNNKKDQLKRKEIIESQCRDCDYYETFNFMLLDISYEKTYLILNSCQFVDQITSYLLFDAEVCLIFCIDILSRNDNIVIID